jgi:hypothetical protein
MGRSGDFCKLDRARNIHLLTGQSSGLGQLPQNRPTSFDRLLQETEIIPEVFVGMGIGRHFVHHERNGREWRPQLMRRRRREAVDLGKMLRAS